MSVSDAERQKEFSFREGWCNNGKVRLHYVVSNCPGAERLAPIVYVHHGFGTAENFVPEMEAFWPRKCVSCSLRGRGKSDAPETGYTFEENVSDIHSLVRDLRLSRICIMGWSIGVTFSIAYAAQHPDLVSGLVLLDYPARYPKYSSGWADRWLSEPSIRDNPGRIRALRGLERESREVLLWDELNSVKAPVMLMKGGAEGSLLKEEDMAKYARHCQQLIVSIFRDSGHDMSRPDFDRFIRTVKKFLESIDALSSS